MRTTSFLAPLLFAATSLAQAVEEGIAPSSPPPAGCKSNANVNFTIGTLKFGHSTKRESAVEAADSALVCNLHNGILRDRDSRTGSIVANRQFQFDGPPQAGSIYTGGFSICANGSLAIGGTTRWWQCSSGGFYNLYDEWIGAQCEEIRIQVTFPVTTSSSSLASASASATASVTLASVVSSLATLSGEVSTVSKSAVGPSASFSSTPGASLASATSSGSSTTSSASSAAAASDSSNPTAAAEAPPASGAASASFGVAKGSMLGAFVVIFGAALIL
ncbi:hypothetical protein BDU57DRAFT_437640 [Ampelomyces quisqualis]|uniref:Cell wall mannoprotein PIR1-like C-terminal domain-containing protein n=1 Tax=Ampelomyces quisqualis TaxID=50730 RepID=A0A6A5R0D6_AMPQU|nr:hypothetical protein BDU57DRAFT_437640 [Ampelomyces quisqualis]